MTFKFSDYTQPSGHYVVTDDGLLPLASQGGTVAFVGSAMHAGIGDPSHAREIDEAVDRSRRSIGFVRSSPTA